MDASEKVIAKQLADAFQRAILDVKDIEPKTVGGSGYIFRVKMTENDEALKILRPDQYDQEELRRGFEVEGELLCEISHPRIVKGFNKGEFEFQGMKLPWYTMEYFPHDALDKVVRRGPSQNPLPRKFPVYISLMRQVLEALKYIHSLQPARCHLDIKEANLLVDMTRPESPTLKLSDFGVSKLVDRNDEPTNVRGSLLYWPKDWQKKLKGQIPSNLNRALILLPRRDIPTAVDLHMLSVAFSAVLRELFPGQQDSYWYRALELLLEKMNWDHDQRRTDSKELYRYLAEGNEASKALEDLLTLERTPALPHPLEEPGALRVPINPLASFGNGLRDLLDSPWFQRLRRVRQLGVAHLVYPGAVHTRFEHAIGAYSQTLQYIKALLENKNSPWFAIHFSADEIRTLAVISLCHDLGHYSFAHQLEDLDLEIWTKHEKLSYDILTGEILQSYPSLESVFGHPKQLRTIIEDQWNVDYEMLVRMFSYCYRADLKGKGQRGNEPRSWRAAAEIVNGPIDADKFDYLRRDSHHCGVSYGFVSDPSRFLSSLTIAFDDVGTHLAVTEKGRVDAEFIPVVRYAMFSEVYWHHTVRAFTAMVRKALQLASSWEHPPLTIENLLRWSDDRVLRELNEAALKYKAEGVAELVRMVSERKPYVRVYTLRKQDNETLYDALTARRVELMGGNDWESDRDLIYKIFGVANIKSHHILWDIPQPGKDRLIPVPIADIHGNVWAKDPGPLWSSLSENFEKWVRKIRLFVHPDFRPSRLSRQDEEMRNREFQQRLAERIGA